jgi:hypothetical protein
MSGTIHPFPEYAFMAWCSVKAQGKLYLYLSPYDHIRVKPQKDQEYEYNLDKMPGAELLSSVDRSQLPCKRDKYHCINGISLKAASYVR